MNLHEYQSKLCLESYGLPVPKRVLARSPLEAKFVVDFFSAPQIVAKVQIHAGGRGKAGGVKIIDRTTQAVEGILNQFLGKKIVTHQTHAAGQPIHAILFEESIEIEKEFYLAMLIDRTSQKIQILASRFGGVEVESQSIKNPNHTQVFPVNFGIGIQTHHAMNVTQHAFQLPLEYSAKILTLLQSLYTAFLDTDASLIEINPLILTKDLNLLALDSKMTIDDNALYRQSNWAQQYDSSQDDPKEVLARSNDLSYIALDGTIGCLVNGAGLAMATMDLIQYAGGSPANFLDVGGAATEERVTKAFQIILQDRDVKVIFVNIFGGIVRCNVIAEGILAAIQKTGIQTPIVVRLQGNQAMEAQKILSGSRMAIFVEDQFLPAAQKAIQLSKD